VSEALARACSPAMHVSIYVDVLGGVCSAAAEKILELPDLSPQDCDDVHGVLESLWVDTVSAAAQHLVHGVGGDENRAVRLAGMSVEEMIEGACQPLRKLKALGWMFKVRMVEIVEDWERGHLQKCGLTQGEVLGVLQAVFEDNPHRRQCLDRVLAFSGDA
jgi:hypothetical protein